MTRTTKTRRARLRLALATTMAGALALAATLGAREARADDGATPASATSAQAGGGSAADPKSAARSEPREARGEFDVKVAPLAEDAAEGITLGRMSLVKTFRGALAASSKGEMLTVDTPQPQSGAYAATERVTGTLDGRRGSFALVHVGTMSKGSYRLSISVVPESGTGELAGIEGTLGIEIRDGKHFYVLAYTLPAR